MWSYQRKPAFERAIVTGMSLLLLLSSCSGGDAAERAIVVEESPASLSQSTPSQSEEPGFDSKSAEVEAEPLTEEELLLAAAEQQLKEQAAELGMRHTADFWFIDLDVPPEEREWQQKTVYSDVAIDTEDINQLLWLTRTRLYSEEYPAMAVAGEKEVSDDDEFDYSIVLDFGDAGFPPTQEHLSGFMANYSSVYEARIGLVVTVNGQPADAIPLAQGYGFADLVRRELGTVCTAAELFASQQRPAYHDENFYVLENRPVPYLRDEEGYNAYTEHTRDWSDLPKGTQQELSELFLPQDPVLYALNEYLYQVIPQNYVELTDLEFDDARELDNRTMQRIAFRRAGRVLAVSDQTSDEELNQYLGFMGTPPREELFILAQSPEEVEAIYGIWPNREVILAEHLETAARLVFGPDITLRHESMRDKTWSYKSLAHCYTHFPGGTGDGYGGGAFPIVLDYEDKGDYYLVTAAFYQNYDFSNWQGVESVEDKSDEYGEMPSPTMTVYNAAELIRKVAPRAEIRLDKGGEDGLIFAGFHYIGHAY